MDMTGKRRGIMIKAGFGCLCKGSRYADGTLSQQAWRKTGVPPIHVFRMIHNDGTTRVPVRMSGVLVRTTG